MNSEYFKDVYTKLKKDKKSMFIMVLGLVGIMLILFSELGDESKAETKGGTQEMQVICETQLTESLEKLIENIDGAGKTKVMLTFESYSESAYAADTQESSGNDGEKDFSKEYIIIDGADGEQGLLLKITAPEVRGVAVVCQGGSNPVIKEQIISTVSALFDISSNKISVATMAK